MRAAAIATLLLLSAACSDKTTETGFSRPPGTVAVGIEVDDTPSQVYRSYELAWKGSWRYDAATRIATRDDQWTGPYPSLCDDGPWTEGGHEPEGARAGDHVLGATMFIVPPATQEEVLAGRSSYEYGLIDVAYAALPPAGFGNGWIWPAAPARPHASFALAAQQATDLVAMGPMLPAFGTVDLRLTIDTAQLDPRYEGSSPAAFLSWVGPKSSAWGWGLILLGDDGTRGDAVAGDGVYTFVMSEWVGPGTARAHGGLLHGGDEPDFVWVLGPEAVGGDQYLTHSGVGFTAGLTAATRPPGGEWTPRPILVRDDLSGTGGRNTYLVVP